ncbi:MAG: DUF6079 family protein [Thermoanaerobaculaceae bacterium]|nr:DUF6079 family protein [Thermoanaerobaculaceae bacterium]
MQGPLIRDLVRVVPRPTVVRLSDLQDASAGWLVESYHRTTEIERHLKALQHVLQQPHGSGAFLIGAYGSGKSHFLAYLARLVEAGGWMGGPAPRVVPVSLLNFRAEAGLEDLVGEAVGLPGGGADRRQAWGQLAEDSPAGVLLLLDEVSEFLRSKPTAQAFNEDVRFLQFLGEWALDHRLWVVAAAQEQVEHAGKLESALYRKLKDRFPLRLLLTPTHVRELIRDHLLVKEPAYPAAVRALSGEIQQALPGAAIDFAALEELYPLHPVTLELLEEVRDHFSQTRGVVDFVLTRLGGDTARGVEPFLDRRWGELLTPDAIFDHFADLFEVQPEFCEIAQSVLAHYRRHMGELLGAEAAQLLAWRLLKLLVLVQVSRQREGMSAAEASSWLLFRATSIAPEKNLQVVERTLHKLAAEGRFVRERGGRFDLDLKDDSSQRLEAVLAREVAELAAGSEDAVFELLAGGMAGEGFNPFELHRESWQHRTVRWHFHERHWAVYLGNGDPPPCPGTALCIRLPWGQPAPAAGVPTLLPQAIPVSRELVELAALLRLQTQPGSRELRALIERRIRERHGLLAAQVRSAYGDAVVAGADGRRERLAQPQTSVPFGEWLDRQAIWLLQRSFPSFERFAPSHGPLPREAYRALARTVAEGGGWERTGNDLLTLVSEGYLVPMGLLRRDAGGYRHPRLDQHELARLVMTLVDQQPPVSAVYQALSGSVYGLVPDQIHVLLVFLLAQGELDIQKSRRSYRELYETFPTPAQYDRIVPGRSLSAERLAALEELCTALDVRRPKQWTLASQRLAVRQLREAASRLRGRLRGLAARLEGLPEGEKLRLAIGSLMEPLASLDRTPDELEAFEQLAFEAGSMRRLAVEIARLQDMPDRLPVVLGEARRLAHLRSHPALSRVRDEELRSRLDGVGGLPELDDLVAVEQTLARARSAYEAWCVHYREAHGGFWQGVAEHPAWTWQPPAVATSRHLGLREELTELSACRERAAARRCGGLGSLEFQAICACGFDGETAPVQTELARWEILHDSIESTLRRYFAQPRVGELLRSWHGEGVELSDGLQAYLAGRAPVPEVSDLDAFDRHLAGVEVVEEVDGDELLASIADRTWEPGELARELERLLAGRGDRRLRIARRREPGVPAPLLRWCVEQALRTATAVPKGLPAISPDVAALVRPGWVHPASLLRLETLDLGEAVEDRVLGFVLDGHLEVPVETVPGSLAEAVAAVVATASRPLSLEELATLAAGLYTWHPRLERVAGRRWLDRLQALADTRLSIDVPDLVEALGAFAGHQLVIVDCLGLPLLSAARGVLAAALPAWLPALTVFAQVRPPTTTESCLATLASGGVNRPLHKLNAVDRLLHERHLAFAELRRLAAAELEVGLRQLGRRLDPAQPVLLLADHGFRLAPDGRAFVHGGASTLERVVPLLDLQPL